MQGQTRLRRIAEPEQADEELLAEEPIEQNARVAHAQAMDDARRKATGIALQMALRTLSQKTIVALATLYSLLLAGAVFWVFWRILADPSVLKLVGGGMFAVFAFLMVVFRKR